MILLKYKAIVAQSKVRIRRARNYERNYVCARSERCYKDRDECDPVKILLYNYPVGDKSSKNKN